MLEELLIHLITCFAFYLLFIEWFGVKRTIAIVLLIGIWKEYSDMMDGNPFGWHDYLGNILGIGLGYLTSKL